MFTRLNHVYPFYFASLINIRTISDRLEAFFFLHNQSNFSIEDLSIRNCKGMFLGSPMMGRPILDLEGTQTPFRLNHQYFCIALCT